MTTWNDNVWKRFVIDRVLLRIINVEQRWKRGREGGMMWMRERERSEEAWYNGINRSTSQHHAAATVGETWNINQNIWTFQKIEECKKRWAKLVGISLFKFKDKLKFYKKSFCKLLKSSSKCPLKFYQIKF